MQRRRFSREVKFEVVRLVKDRGAAVAQAARDLDVHENVLRKWVRAIGRPAACTFRSSVSTIPGDGTRHWAT